MGVPAAFPPRSAGAVTTQRSQSRRGSPEGDQGARLGPFCYIGAGFYLLFLVARLYKNSFWGGASGARQPTTFPDAVLVLPAGNPLPQQPLQGGGRAWRAGRGKLRCSRALAASKAIGSAQSPHAGLQQPPPRIGARVRAVRAVPKPLRRGLAPPPHSPGTTNPPLCPALQMQHLGPLPAAVPAGRPRLRERARKARSPPGCTHRAQRALQQSLPQRCAPPCLSYLHIPRFWPISGRLSRSGWLLPGRKGSGWRRMRGGGLLEPRLLLL